MSAMPPKDLTCAEMVTLMTEYLEGTLSAEARARFEAHLMKCDGCDRYLEQMRQTLRAVGTLNEQNIAPESKEKLLEAFRDWKRAHPEVA